MKSIKWLTPAQRQTFFPGCAPASRNEAFAWVAVVTIVLLAQGVPGDSLPTVLLALAVLTVVVSGGQAPGLAVAHAVAHTRRVWWRGEVTR